MSKILVAEDDETLASVVYDWLVHEHHTVEVVNNGLEALDRLRVYKYDLVVLDIGLPGATGLEIIREFRNRGGNCPVLFLTARGDVDDKEKGLDSGADDYLTKPFQPKELCARVRALLRRPPQFAGTQLNVAGMILEPGTLSVEINQQTVSLRPREFALLEFLMRHPNQAFSAEALLDRVWHSETDTTEETVRVTVKRLRTRLGDGSPIATVHGAGYMLKASK
jgi:DNA-binding response OmpR family regulator